MSDVTRVTVSPGREEELIEKARQYREAEPSRMEAERAAATKLAHKAAREAGTHRQGPDGRFRTEYPQRATIDQTVGPDDVRFGSMIVHRDVAVRIGLVDEAGRTTAKGAALAKAHPDSGPSSSPSRVPSAAQTAARPSVVEQREQLDPESDDVEETDEEGTEDLDEDDREVVTLSDSPDAADALIASGNFDKVVDAAEVAIGALSQSETYSRALDSYLDGVNVSSETVAGIAQDLGVSTAEAARLVDSTFDGFRGEAAKAVSGILSPAEAASFAECIVDQPERFNRAARLHVRGGSTVGWVNEAMEYRSVIDSLGNLDDLVGTHAGGEVVREGDRFMLHRDGHAPMDLRVAAARGLVRPR